MSTINLLAAWAMTPLASCREEESSWATWSTLTLTYTTLPRTPGVPQERKCTRRSRAMKKAGPEPARARSSPTTCSRASPQMAATPRSTIPRPGNWRSISPSDGTAQGTIPQLSSPNLGYELGPSLRLQDGRVLEIGASQHTALYNPIWNTWEAGPDISGTLNGIASPFGADDAPGAILPNGHVIFAADAGASQVTSSGNITAGSPVITGIPSTAIFQVFWSVSGTGIPGGAYIASVDSPSQVTISSPATANDQWRCDQLGRHLQQSHGAV